MAQIFQWSTHHIGFTSGMLDCSQWKYYCTVISRMLWKPERYPFFLVKISFDMLYSGNIGKDYKTPTQNTQTVLVTRIGKCGTVWVLYWSYLYSITLMCLSTSVLVCICGQKNMLVCDLLVCMCLCSIVRLLVSKYQQIVSSPQWYLCVCLCECHMRPNAWCCSLCPCACL